ncbi:hypothetical protein [Streptomyces sp. NPDC021212]|uniref:hypothetical protein n=1 Tax=Streptomyces sp. NPDC021212 TaxID=3365118 RepID=UPI0037A216F1
MLLRLAYLGVSNAFAMLRLLPMTDRDKDAEILTLRHQITVLERQLGKDKVRFTPAPLKPTHGSDATQAARPPVPPRPNP